MKTFTLFSLPSCFLHTLLRLIRLKHHIDGTTAQPLRILCGSPLPMEWSSLPPLSGPTPLLWCWSASSVMNKPLFLFLLSPILESYTIIFVQRPLNFLCIFSPLNTSKYLSFPSKKYHIPILWSSRSAWGSVQMQLPPSSLAKGYFYLRHDDRVLKQSKGLKNSLRS